MFKRTNKMWKVVALALVLCMLPVAAFGVSAASTVSITTTAEVAAAGFAENGVITIAGTTTSKTVTILAVRSDSSVSEPSLNTAEVWSKVVYAGQQKANAGAFSFAFVPKADVTGSMITVFVGGKGVSELASLTIAISNAPSVTPVWYEGENLVLKLANVTGEKAQAWYEAKDTFTINDIDVAAVATPNEGYTEIEIGAVEGLAAPITSISIVDTEEVYDAVAWTGSVAQSKKPAGTITFTYPAEKDSFVAGAEATLTAKNADAAFGDAWEAALAVKTGVSIKYGTTEIAAEKWSYAEDALTIEFPVIATADATEVITISGIANYADATSESIKIVAPTVLDHAILDAMGKTLAPVDTNGGEEEVNDAYHVVLPAPTLTYGSSIAWEVKVDDAAYADAASYISEGKFNLVRDAAATKKYQLKAVVKNGTFIAKEVEYDAIEIKKLGVPAFGDITAVEILKDSADVAGTNVEYSDGLVLTAKAVGAENVEADYVWTIGGESVSTAATFSPTKANITKTVTVTATPKAPFEGQAISSTVTIVLPEAYKPEFTVAFSSAKITAGKAVAASATTDDTYAEAPGYTVGEVTYTFYEVAATDADSADAAIAKVKAGAGTVNAEQKYAKAGNYAVVKAEATYSIAGKDFGTIEAYAALAVQKKSGGAGGGASLVTKPTTPENPGTDERDPEDVAGDPIANGAAAFTDVDKTTYAWAYDSIDALAKAGIIKGMTSTTFGPELETTNAQVIALAVRIAGLKADDAKTALIDAAHWAYAEVAIADAKDILGVFGDKIDAEGATTREVAFTLLYNALKAAGIAMPEVADAIEYTDASSIDAACVEAITALTKAGIVNGMGDGTLAPKATITRAQLAKILGLAKALVK